MKTCFLNVLITILGIICGLLPSSANDTFQFELTPDKLDSTWVCESADGCYGVRVLLKDPYRKYFSALTAHHIGEELSITYSNLTLFTSVVMTKIDSGAIHIGNCDSKEDAERLVETLQGKSEKNTNNESENWKKTKACERTVATEYVKDGIKHLNEFRSTDNRAFLIEALESTEKALKADNDYCLGYYWKAVILAKSEDYQKAILTLNEGIEKPCENINDKIGSFYFLRGMIKHKAGEKKSRLRITT